MSILDDIGTYLTDNNIVAGVTGWDLHKSYMPDDADKAVAIYETGGGEPDQTSDTKYDTPTFQVKVRGGTWGYSAAKVKAEEVWNLLNDGTIANYVYIFATHSGVLSLGYDKNDRPELTINFEAMKQR